jgi:small subunit ribosomal protein S20
MANIKANIKTQRKDAKRNQRNRSYTTTLKGLVKKSRADKKPEDLRAVYKKVDSMVAKGKITKNKGNRIKSKLAQQTHKQHKK